jgi:hypothetical protein
MSSAGIIANHSTDRAAIVSRRIGRERQVMDFRLVSQSIQHNARLNPRNFFVGIDLEDPVHVLRKIEDDRNIAALSGKTRPGAASQDRSTVLLADSYGCNDVIGVTWDHESDGNLPVV